MEFRVLGPLEVVDGDRSVPLGGHKQRALLATLLLRANEVVPTDRLIDAVWGDAPPEGVANTLQVHVSKLRKSLTGGATSSDVLASRSSGYILRVGRDELDMSRFERLVEEAREDRLERRDERSATKLREALSLWRGPAFADLSYEPFAQAAIQRLEEMRVSGLEDRIDSDLALGHHAELVPELEGLVTTYPLRERLRRHLMLALYRSGRQSEALQAFEATRRTLREELGVGPGSALQQLNEAILVRAPELELTTGRDVEPHNVRPPVAPVAEAAEVAVLGEEVRKTVTVVFSDVVGSTSLSASLDPEALRQVLTRYFQEVQTVFERHGGTVEKFIGDAVVAVFGLARAREDDALRAIRAAAEIRDSLERLNEELERDWGVKLRVRTGVSTGEVVAGDASMRQAMVTGTPVNLAARLQQAAEPQEILIDALTLDLVQDAFVGEAVGPVDLKGIGAAIQAFRMTRVVPGALGRERPHPPLVGRKRELAILADAFEEVAGQRDCRLITVIGSAGVGKSRLAEEFLVGVSAAPVVLRGRCLPYGEGITYWPVAEIVRQASGIHEGQSAEQVRSRIEAVLGEGEHGKTIAERVAQLVGVAGAEAVAQETFWAIRRFLHALAERGPLVLAIDDLQWAEPTLLDLLEDLVARMTDVPILMLCLARPELIETRQRWAEDDRSSSIHLERLGDDEGRELLRNLLGAAIASDVEDRIIRAADGNPLFLEESVSLLLESGSLRLSEGGWVSAMDPMTIPIAPSVQAVLAARLDGLSLQERTVVTRASVIGEVFYWGAVAALCPQELRSSVGTHLQALANKQLIRPAESDFAMQDAFRFHHILIRDVAYESIPKSTRAELHEQVAAWLEEAAGERVREFEEILGFHLEHAYALRVSLGPVDDAADQLASRAVGVLWDAGNRAMDRGDSRAAVELLERATSMIQAPDARVARLLIDVHFPLRAMGEFQRAEELLARAVHAAEASGDEGTIWRARLDQADLDTITHPGRLRVADVVQLAQLAIPVLEGSNVRGDLVHALAILADCQMGLGHFSLAKRASERAAREARATRRIGDEIEALESLIHVLTDGPERVAEAIPRAREILERLRTLSHYTAWALSHVAILEAMSGHFLRARDLVSTGLAQADQRGEHEFASLIWFKGEIEALAGNGEEAERAMRRSVDIFERIGAKGQIGWLATSYAKLLIGQDRAAEAGAWLKKGEEGRAPDEVWPHVVGRSLRARILAMQGQFKKAETLGQQAVKLAGGTDWLELQADAHSDLAHVLLLAERREAAGKQAEEALRVYERKGHLVGAGRTERLLEEIRPAGK